jgi:alpha/beta superfamily hydrolase
MKFARLKQYAVSTALTLSIIFSFGMGMPAAAFATTPMDGMAHENTAVINCINQHHVAPGPAEKTVIDNLDDDDEPTPKPLPYFVQFQTAFVEQRQTTPEDIVRSSSYNPPDIIRLTSNIRF